MITRAEVANGPVDVLINNAALMVPGPLVHMTAEDVRTIVTVNTIAPLELARGAMKTMIERRHGSIVNVTSLAGHLAVRNIIPYCSSKAALTTATEALRREVAGTGVHARLVVLGYVATDMMDESHADPVAKAQAIRLGRLPSLSTESVSADIVASIEHDRPVTVLPPLATPLHHLRLLPQRLVDGLMAGIPRSL